MIRMISLPQPLSVRWEIIKEVIILKTILKVIAWALAAAGGGCTLVGGDLCSADKVIWVPAWNCLQHSHLQPYGRGGQAEKTGQGRNAMEF